MAAQRRRFEWWQQESIRRCDTRIVIVSRVVVPTARNGCKRLMLLLVNTIRHTADSFGHSLNRISPSIERSLRISLSTSRSRSKLSSMKRSSKRSWKPPAIRDKWMFSKHTRKNLLLMVNLNLKSHKRKNHFLISSENVPTLKKIRRNSRLPSKLEKVNQSATHTHATEKIASKQISESQNWTEK